MGRNSKQTDWTPGKVSKKVPLILLWALWSLLLLHFSTRLSVPSFSTRGALSQEAHGLALPEDKRDALRPEALGLICADCSCQNGSYIASPDFVVDSLATIQAMPPTPLDAAGATLVARMLFHRIVIANLLAPIFTNATEVNHLMHSALSCPDSLFAFNLRGLVPNLPTIYPYTRTGLSGRLGTRRAKYFDRHIASFREYQQFVEEHSHMDGTPASQRQMLWIVIEDGPTLDSELARLLAASEMNYIYIAHGPTRHFGKAQWNLAWTSISVLHKVLGDGPAVAVDDDSLVLPELYLRLWKIKVVMMWQMGNYKTENGWWEGPVFEKGKLVRWEVAAHVADRVFPIDLGAFALNTSVVGVELKGPQYVPKDARAQETEFVEQVRQSRNDVEPLCDNTIEDNCRFTWHNKYFPEDGIEVCLVNDPLPCPVPHTLGRQDPYNKFDEKVLLP